MTSVFTAARRCGDRLDRFAFFRRGNFFGFRLDVFFGRVAVGQNHAFDLVERAPFSEAFVPRRIGREQRAVGEVGVDVIE